MKTDYSIQARIPNQENKKETGRLYTVPERPHGDVEIKPTFGTILRPCLRNKQNEGCENRGEPGYLPKYI